VRKTGGRSGDVGRATLGLPLEKEASGSESTQTREEPKRYRQDVAVVVPEELLEQARVTRLMFMVMMGLIAAISLLVGGIGIMNIMLASVMERIREIGVRLAMGARKTDIIFQFVAEATLISISGGFIGVILGIVLAKIIMEVAGILTIVSIMSIIISFGVSATVGIVFGLMPARQASQQDPVTSLRHD